MTVADINVEQISQPSANCLTVLASMSDLPVQLVFVLSPRLRKTIVFQQSFAAMSTMFAMVEHRARIVCTADEATGRRHG
jgi:hypothetical protein